MEDIENYFEQLRLKASRSNEVAIGYPVNRQHAFSIDLNLLGVKDNSMCTTYLNNIASPYEYGTYISGHIKELEIKLIAKVAKHLGMDQDNHFGYVTYGGSEANLAGIWWHKKYLIKNISDKVTLLCSKYSHYSLRKIADILSLNIVQIDASESHINLNDLELKLKSITTPIIFVANFGTTVFGAIDNIYDIYSLLNKYKTGQFKIHADGAIYGLLVPYFEHNKHLKTIFDYVDTLSFSGHKFLGTFSISGMVLTKKDYLKEVFHEENIKIGYIQKAIDITIAGSRQGFYAAELYLLIEEALKYEGNKQKLELIWQDCINLSSWFYQQLKKIFKELNLSESIIFHNYLRVVIPVPLLQEKTDFLGRKYGLMPINNSHLGIYIFPRITKGILEDFLVDYKSVLVEQIGK